MLPNWYHTYGLSSVSNLSSCRSCSLYRPWQYLLRRVRAERWPELRVCISTSRFYSTHPLTGGSPLSISSRQLSLTTGTRQLLNLIQPHTPSFLLLPLSSLYSVVSVLVNTFQTSFGWTEPWLVLSPKKFPVYHMWVLYTDNECRPPQLLEL